MKTVNMENLNYCLHPNKHKLKYSIFKIFEIEKYDFSEKYYFIIMIMTMQNC